MGIIHDPAPTVARSETPLEQCTLHHILSAISKE